ncbi:MAG: TetR/AcrR family transcriptional regulator [Prevotella sp.]|nr:TetR/AcrR family transcriptional regulator [Prevotella sp.]
MHKNNSNTTSRNDLQQRVLDKAMSLFKQNGIKAVKMDDIASAMSMSKRTLYELYENKEQLLYEGISRDISIEHKELEKYSRSASNEMEIVIFVFKRKLKELGTVNPLFFSDLHKYERVLTLLQQSSEQNRKRSVEFINKGVEHGYFIPALDYEIVSKMGDGVMNHVVQKKLYEQYPLRDLFVNCVYVQVRGVCTEKGRQMLDELFSNL